MTLLLVSWLLFAPLFLLLRWAVLPRAIDPSIVAGGGSRKVARTWLASRQMLEGVFVHVERAYLMRQHASVTALLPCLQQGTGALLREVQADLDVWRSVADSLTTAPSVLPMRGAALRLHELRALAWADQLGRTAIIGPASRLRLRLAVLRTMTTLLLRKTKRLGCGATDGLWLELEAARADLDLLLEALSNGRRALTEVDAGDTIPS